jgi:predicted alpha/beta superfamily hydrolase
MNSSGRILVIVPWTALFLVGSETCGTEKAVPLVIGETFTIESKILSEKRRINVYLPRGYAESLEARLPVLYLPDGGIAEDFLHIAGLLQVLVSNGTIRPFLLVGIENTERRRDMTGPTENDDEKKIATRIGGSKAFREFMRDELMPNVKERYRTTNERAIIGESLAGHFVVETFLFEPEMFDIFIAVDPSLWWNNRKLVMDAGKQLSARPMLKKTLYLACSGEERTPGLTLLLADTLKMRAPEGVHWHFAKLPEEKHATIYHPAALKAFREVLKPVEK